MFLFLEFAVQMLVSSAKRAAGRRSHAEEVDRRRRMRVGGEDVLRLSNVTEQPYSCRQRFLFARPAPGRRISILFL
jgi:hypothetical protein